MKTKQKQQKISKSMIKMWIIIRELEDKFSTKFQVE